MSPADLASELARVAHEINAVGDLDRSRLLRSAAAAIQDLRGCLPSGDRLRGEALDVLLDRLRGASRVSANNEGAEVAMLLLDAALAIRTVLGVRHEVVVENGKKGSVAGPEGKNE